MQVQIHPSAIGWEGLYPLGRKASNKVRALPLIESILHVRVNATLQFRVAGLGRLSAGAKNAIKTFVKRVFTIFATNPSFLRVIANLHI